MCVKHVSPSRVQPIGFTDDLTIMTTTKRHLALEDLVNPFLEAIHIWLISSGLEIASQKSEVVILARK